jgi:hypothetical protein
LGSIGSRLPVVVLAGGVTALGGKNRHAIPWRANARITPSAVTPPASTTTGRREPIEPKISPVSHATGGCALSTADLRYPIVSGTCPN